MPNDDHPQIPDDPRFRKNPETGKDEFLMFCPNRKDKVGWMPLRLLSACDLLPDSLAREDCANAAYRALHEVAEAHGLQGGKTPQAWYRIHDDALDRADEWAEWAKQAP